MKKIFMAVCIVLFIIGTAYALPPVSLPGANDFSPFKGTHRVNSTLKCQHCNGSGKITKIKIVWSKLKKKLVKARQSATCPKCSGSGVVKSKNSKSF